MVQGYEYDTGSALEVPQGKTHLVFWFIKVRVNHTCTKHVNKVSRVGGPQYKYIGNRQVAVEQAFSA